ncbi:tubulin binding cofactor A-domain-containing protein [Gautieria morchelliformis]|nr:tubulin binding cofactor A-domain-containing protein [Gautieria morchelliformis]
MTTHNYTQLPYFPAKKHDVPHPPSTTTAATNINAQLYPGFKLYPQSNTPPIQDVCALHAHARLVEVAIDMQWEFSHHAKILTTNKKPAVRRQLKIKSGSVKRILKEYNMYKKEAEDQQRRVDKYTADAADEWDIKNQQKLLVESQKMIPETQKRLGTAVSELRELVISARPTLSTDEDLMKAEEALEEAGI